MTQTLIAVSALKPENLSEAKAFAHTHDLPLVKTPHHYEYVLLFDNDRISLAHASNPKIAPIYIDFASTQQLKRAKNANRKNELLLKAIGLPRTITTPIIDMTAGFGSDAFVLAAYGYSVIAIERSPIIYALLNNALMRAHNHPQLKSIVERITLIYGDARALVPTMARADVLYLDPMFPERTKTALVKYEMRLLKEIVGIDKEPSSLLEIGLSCANKKVVVKRPRLSTHLTNLMPNYAIYGKSSRFDVYLAP